MDADIIKRLKAWFYLRLPAEDWIQFGTSAEQVLRTFDDDPDQEYALLEFAHTVIMVEAQKLDHDQKLSLQIAAKRLDELKRLGIDMEQFIRAWDKMNER
jgi:hypothetical protein